MPAAAPAKASFVLAFALFACTGNRQPTDPTAGDTLIVVAGAQQSATVATAVPTDPIVLLRDGSGAPRRNVAVAVVPEAGGGWVVAPNTTTDSTGRATVRWYMGCSPDQTGYA
ncbi:MAG: hypothetical protein ACRENP_28425 [Longimicrobiales bacterium]